MILLEFLTGFGKVIIYFIICATGALLLRRYTNTPCEVFRKVLHLILLLSLLVFVFAFRTWWLSALAAIAFVAAAYPVVSLAEKKVSGFSEFITERNTGEIRRSLVLVFSMFAIMIGMGWGWLGERWLVLACVYAWGFGDGAAALIGTKYGKRRIKGPFIDERKTVEGTLAMFIVSFFSVLFILLASRKIVWYGYLPIALLAAAVSAIVELHTQNGMDTLTCPFAAAVVILPLVHLWAI